MCGLTQFHNAYIMLLKDEGLEEGNFQVIEKKLFLFQIITVVNYL